MPCQLSIIGQFECVLGQYSSLAKTAACSALERSIKPGMWKHLPPPVRRATRSSMKEAEGGGVEGMISE